MHEGKPCVFIFMLQVFFFLRQKKSHKRFEPNKPGQNWFWDMFGNLRNISEMQIGMLGGL